MPGVERNKQNRSHAWRQLEMETILRNTTLQILSQSCSQTSYLYTEIGWNLPVRSRSRVANLDRWCSATPGIAVPNDIDNFSLTQYKNRGRNLDSIFGALPNRTVCIGANHTCQSVTCTFTTADSRFHCTCSSALYASAVDPAIPIFAPSPGRTVSFDETHTLHLSPHGLPTLSPSQHQLHQRTRALEIEDQGYGFG